MKTIIITIGGNSGNIVLDAVRIAKEKKKQTIYALITPFISEGSDAYNKTEAVQESIKSFSPDVFLRFEGSELISEYGELLLHDGMKQIALRIWREIAKYL